MQSVSNYKCCFIGHRKIEITEQLKNNIYKYIESLIKIKHIKLFLFGSCSQFDDLCYMIVTKLKTKYIDIKRIFIRSSHENISESYKSYLLQNFEETIYPIECKNSGKLSYITRNKVMIDQSQYCVFYYDKNYLPDKRRLSKKDIFSYQPNSGTAFSYKYAIQKKKMIRNFYINNIKQR